MKNAAVGKAIPFILPIAVWLSITAYMALVQFVLVPVFNPLDGFTGLVASLTCLVIQALIVWALTFIANKKFGFGIKKLVITLPMMFVLFAVYNVPTLYLFVYTDEWSIMGHVYQMNRIIAAFWITLQYGIVMLITLTAVHANEKSDTTGE